MTGRLSAMQHEEPMLTEAQQSQLQANVAADFDARDVLETTSQTLTDALALSDENGIVLAVNAAYQELYGFQEHEVVGQSFAVIFPESQRSAAEAGYRQIFEAAVPSVHLVAIRRADGRHRAVQSRTAFVERGGGRVAMLSAVHDVTAAQPRPPREPVLPHRLDLQSLASLCDVHVRSALGFAQALLSDAAQAEQVVEDTLLAMWRAGVTADHATSVVRPLVLSVVRQTAGHVLLAEMRAADGHAGGRSMDRWWSRLAR